MKNKLSIIVLSVAALFLSSCASYHIRQGDRMYDAMAYNYAVPEYQKGLASGKSFPQAQIRLADSYEKMNNTILAEQEYAKVVALPEAQPIHKLKYAQMLIHNGKYETAKTWLASYLKDNPKDKAAEDLLASCDMISSLRKDSLRYSVEPMILNTGQSNFSPVQYKEGLVFTSDRPANAELAKSKKAIYSWTGKQYLDLFYSQPDKQPGSWTVPEPLKGDVNGKYHDGTCAFVGDTLMYFTRDNYVKGKAKKGSAQVVNLKIYECSLIGDKWTNIREFPFNSDEYSCGHPTLSANGNTLYFTSDMPGGYGGTDIWMTHRFNGEWSKPVNLGPNVNTPFNEMFPQMMGDSMIYFSSEGHINMGGLDIFQTRKEGNDWSEAQNMGYPINTSQDDFGLVRNDTTGGWLSSNRENSLEDKIYSFVDNQLQFAVDGLVLNKITQQPVEGVLVELINRITGHRDTMTTAADGVFAHRLEASTDYVVIGSKYRYFTNTAKLSTVGLKQSMTLYVKLKLVLEMEEIIVNKPYAMENIYYNFDKSDIRPDAQPSMDKLVTLMKDNPDIMIELSSHTDSRGSDEYNQKLSDRRAQAAVDYIVAHDISKDRLVAKGYGETRLLNGCKSDVPCMEISHQKNRRTEFKITGFVKKTEGTN